MQSTNNDMLLIIPPKPFQSMKKLEFFPFPEHKPLFLSVKLRSC